VEGFKVAQVKRKFGNRLESWKARPRCHTRDDRTGAIYSQNTHRLVDIARYTNDIYGDWMRYEDELGLGLGLDNEDMYYLIEQYSEMQRANKMG
jgi:hypothetical protein